jgi:hypothetical protein
MEIFKPLMEADHEQVLFCYEPSSGYKGIIAIHNTTLCPALGGTRFWNYRTDEEAFVDALRLSRGMTYKAASAGLNLGGGKAVIIGDPRTARREMLFRAHGRFVETLKGRYITAEDVGTSVRTVSCRWRQTTWRGWAGRATPSPVTAYGTYRHKGERARRFGNDSVTGGRSPCRLRAYGVPSGRYLAEGANLVVTTSTKDGSAGWWAVQGGRADQITTWTPRSSPCALGIIAMTRSHASRDHRGRGQQPAGRTASAVNTSAACTRPLRDQRGRPDRVYGEVKGGRRTGRCASGRSTGVDAAVRAENRGSHESGGRPSGQRRIEQVAARADWPSHRRKCHIDALQKQDRDVRRGRREAAAKARSS